MKATTSRSAMEQKTWKGSGEQWSEIWASDDVALSRDVDRDSNGAITHWLLKRLLQVRK